MKKTLIKISIATLTASILLTGCANNEKIKTSSNYNKIKVANYQSEPNYYKPVTLKLPKTTKYDITTYDFSSNIDWLLKFKFRDDYVESVTKTPTAYKISIHSGDGFSTYFWDYKINKADNSIVLNYRDYFEFRKGSGLFASKNEKALQKYNGFVQDTFQRLDDMYIYKDILTVKGEVISKLPPQEVRTNLETNFGNWNSRYEGTLFKGLKNQYIKWNEKNEFIGNRFYRLKNGKLYAVLYTNVEGKKVGIPVSFSIYDYRGGSKVLYASNVKQLISLGDRETFSNKDIPQFKNFIESVVNK